MRKGNLNSWLTEDIAMKLFVYRYLLNECNIIVPVYLWWKSELMSIWHAHDTPYVPHKLIHTVSTFIPFGFRSNFNQNFIVQVDVYAGEQIGFNGVLRYYFIIYFKFYFCLHEKQPSVRMGVRPFATPQRWINSLFHVAERSQSFNVWREPLQIYFDQKHRQNGVHIFQCVSSIVYHYLLWLISLPSDDR